MHRLAFALLFSGLFLSPLFSPALAHQQKAAYIEVLFNQRSGQLEVSQRFNLHDAEHATAHLFGSGADILSSVETQSDFFRYATENFSIQYTDGSEMILEPLGFEIEGNYFWVYQIAELNIDLTEFSVSSTSLHDLWPEQVNWVNVKRNGEIETAVFEGSQSLISISFN